MYHLIGGLVKAMEQTLCQIPIREHKIFMKLH